MESEKKFEQKEGTFSLFRTKTKKQENSPDFTGKALLNGVEIRLSGWLRTPKAGEMYISGSIGEEQQKPATQSQVDSFLGVQAPAHPVAHVDEPFDDLPFN